MIYMRGNKYGNGCSIITWRDWSLETLGRESAKDGRAGGQACGLAHYVYNHADVLEAEMKILLNIIGVLLILAGITFFLQGISVLPGSFMTGNPQWAINGAMMIIIALGLLIWANRPK